VINQTSVGNLLRLLAHNEATAKKYYRLTEKFSDDNQDPMM
jgi:hypothetical protein